MPRCRPGNQHSDFVSIYDSVAIVDSLLVGGHPLWNPLTNRDLSGNRINPTLLTCQEMVVARSSQCNRTLSWRLPTQITRDSNANGMHGFCQDDIAFSMAVT